MDIGDTVCDIHDGIRLDRIAATLIRSESIETTAGAEFIESTVRGKGVAGFRYVNKHLTIIGENEDAELILAASIDGRRLILCFVRV